MMFVKEDTSRDPLTSKIIGAAIEVHRELGPGLLESVYQECMEYELQDNGLAVTRQQVVPITFKSRRLKSGLKLDLVVEGQIVVELKAVEKVLWLHEAQLLTYLKLSGIHRGLLVNFNVPLLKDGITRMVF